MRYATVILTLVLITGCGKTRQLSNRLHHKALDKSPSRNHCKSKKTT
jgi:hypothetical protein